MPRVRKTFDSPPAGSRAVPAPYDGVAATRDGDIWSIGRRNGRWRKLKAASDREGVEAIRRDRLETARSYRFIAADYGISESHARDICTGRKWRDCS